MIWEVPYKRYEIRILGDLIGGIFYFSLLIIPFIFILIKSIITLEFADLALFVTLGIFVAGYVLIVANRVKWHTKFLTKIEVTEEHIILDYYLKNVRQNSVQLPVKKVKMEFFRRGYGGAFTFLNITDGSGSFEQMDNGGWTGNLFAEIFKECKRIQDVELTWDEKDWMKKLDD